MFFEHIGEGIDKNSIPKNLEIELNKRMSRTISEVRADTKDGVCFHCGKPVTSFCNSLNVPHFCLENIGVDGKVTGPNAILGLPSMGISIGKEFPGIGEAGTFRIICRECDSKIFQEYENPDNYYKATPPTQKMLAEMAMKNYLKFISKRKFEIALLEKTLEQCPQSGIEYYFEKTELETRLKTSRIDLDAYINEYRYAKKYASKDNNNGFYIIYYRLLDYVVPVAIQAPIAVSIDLEGNVVNDIVNMDPGYKLVDLHLCVFPLKSQTAIILFINEGEKRYRKFYKQFRKLTEDGKLSVINYLIFLYCEDYFLAKELPSKVDLRQLKNIASLTPVAWDVRPITHASAYAEEFTLSKWNCIPNLLSERYKVR